MPTQAQQVAAAIPVVGGLVSAAVGVLDALDRNPYTPIARIVAGNPSQAATALITPGPQWNLSPAGAWLQLMCLSGSPRAQGAYQRLSNNPTAVCGANWGNGDRLHAIDLVQQLSNAYPQLQYAPALDQASGAVGAIAGGSNSTGTAADGQILGATRTTLAGIASDSSGATGTSQAGMVAALAVGAVVVVLLAVHR